MHNRISVIIVNYYNFSVSIEDCLQSLLDQTVEIDEIVIVNNGDDKPIKIKNEKIKIHNYMGSQNPVNVGFGKAINFAAEVLISKVANKENLIFLLNPDTVVEKNCLEKMLKYHKKTDITAPVVLNQDGSLYPSARIEPDYVTAGMHALLSSFNKNNKWTKQYKQKIDLKKGKLTEVDWCSGAAMLIHLDLFLELGGFDEQFFMYLEDVDLCKRVRNNGGKIVYVHDAVLKHLGSVSTESSFKTKMKLLLEHHKAAFVYYSKWARGYKKLLIPVAALLLILRFSVETTKILFRRFFRPKN